jgi:hypothetical protein
LDLGKNEILTAFQVLCDVLIISVQIATAQQFYSIVLPAATPEAHAHWKL